MAAAVTGYELVDAATGAAVRLLERTDESLAPQSAIEVALWLADPEGIRPPRGREWDKLLDELKRTTARRRAVFWRSAERLGRHNLHGNRPINFWLLEYLGWPKALELVDLDWLLSDCRKREDGNDRRLALQAAIELWRRSGDEDSVRDKIKDAVTGDDDLMAVFAASTAPRVVSEEERATILEMERRQAEHLAEEDERAASWQQFVAEMQADPDQIRQIPPPTTGADSRLFHLWRLAANASGGNNRSSIADISPVEPILGQVLTSALREGLIRFWRPWKPRLKRQRTAADRNIIYDLDSMAIMGVTLEAASSRDWASWLTDEDAGNATRLATLELNGFPDWLTDVAVARPDAVRQELMAEIASELNDPDPERRPEVLQDVARADVAIAKLIAPELFAELRTRTQWSMRALELALDATVRGGPDAGDGVPSFLLERFRQESDPATAGLYIVAAFALAPAESIDALKERLTALSAAQQTEFAQHILPGLFGDTFYRPANPGVSIPFDALLQLVEMAYRAIRPEEDKVRRTGAVLGFDARDHAESARSNSFNQLFQTKGAATYDALMKLAASPDFPVPPVRLRQLAMERALLDGDAHPWQPRDAATFERDHEHAPRTTAELQHLAIRRLEGIQRDLIDSDFAQGSTLKMLPDERAVQKYVAYELQQRARSSYTAERESHVVDEKEPDIRLRAKASAASLPMEVKVAEAENWSISDLEAALVKQLCGQYLRAPEARHGVLLLVHQEPRANGWKDPETGAFLTFPQVVNRLRVLASVIARSTPDSPQPVVAVLDVSSCP